MQRAVATAEPPSQIDTAWILLLLLVTTDLAFIVAHVLYVETSMLRGRPFSLEAENGVPEAFQYVKQFWVALCMASMFRRTRAVVYIGWAMVFAFLLLDDAFQFHERVGLWLSQLYALPVGYGLRPEDTGELLFAAAAGVATMLLIGLGFSRSDEDARTISRDMAVLLILLAALGVGVDILHVIAYFEAPTLLSQFLLIMEDGGEMLVISAMVAYMVNVLNHRGRATVDLWAIMRHFSSQRFRRRA